MQIRSEKSNPLEARTQQVNENNTLGFLELFINSNVMCTSAQINILNIYPFSGDAVSWNAGLGDSGQCIGCCTLCCCSYFYNYSHIETVSIQTIFFLSYFTFRLWLCKFIKPFFSPSNILLGYAWKAHLCLKEEGAGGFAFRWFIICVLSVNPANTQRRHNVVTTSLQRRDVAATL